jgi:nucleotide-binding universal stress UspA family protein
MPRVLVPMQPDHPAKTRAAVGLAIRLHRSEGVAVHLLCVRPQLNGLVASYFKADELRQLQYEIANDELREAREQLKAAGVPYASRIMIGRTAESIAETAAEFGCRRILLGDVDERDLFDRVFGSLADQLRHLLVQGAAAGARPFEVIGY